MNKREVIWLLVRLLGVYFAYLTIVSVVGLIGSVSTLYSLPTTTTTISSTNSNSEFPVAPIGAPNNFPVGQPISPNKSADKPPLDAVSKKVADDAVKNLLLNIFLIVFYGAIGFYLLRDGRVLFALLNREDLIASDRKEINSLGILDSEE